MPAIGLIASCNGVKKIKEMVGDIMLRIMEIIGRQSKLTKPDGVSMRLISIRASCSTLQNTFMGT